tara:strand:+ start:112 stop:498 length:387 start_codon:yes stop_codon:yes gene_type:complete
MDKNKELPFYNVPTAEMVNIQHDVGVVVAKDLYILFLELWRRNCEPIEVNLAKKKLKINVKNLQKTSENYNFYVSFEQKNDKFYIKSKFILQFYEKGLRKKQTRDTWNEKKKMQRKQSFINKYDDKFK